MWYKKRQKQVLPVSAQFSLSLALKKIKEQGITEIGTLT